MINMALIKLNPCFKCKGEVFSSYLENARYRYECLNCGQYFELNACSQLEADTIYNRISNNAVVNTQEKDNG